MDTLWKKFNTRKHNPMDVILHLLVVRHPLDGWETNLAEGLDEEGDQDAAELIDELVVDSVAIIGSGNVFGKGSQVVNQTARDRILIYCLADVRQFLLGGLQVWIATDCCECVSIM